MDLADAALVRIAEREDLTRIFTIDRAHFSLYRPGRPGRFRSTGVSQESHDRRCERRYAATTFSRRDRVFALYTAE
jgi:hypothetical protein